MKAIIVDDEPKAIALLKSYLEHFSQIELLASFRNGLTAFEYLSKEQVDLIFLDINMPILSGISLAKMISRKSKIVFTTAYAEHAVESYEVQTVDYLLKPISLERFTKTMGKILGDPKGNTLESPTMIMLRSGSRTYPIQIDDIHFLKKDGNYMTYHVGQEKILARESMSKSLLALPSYFIQCHRSYLINKKHIQYYDKEKIQIAKYQIPIGNAFKATFFAEMTK